MENWVARNRPSGVDRATAPGAVGRFSFVLGIPTVTAATTLDETYGPVQEGVTWFGGETAARCSVRVSPRAVTPPPVVDAGSPAPVDVPPVMPADAGSPEPADAGSPEPIDAGSTAALDAGSPEPIDAGTEPPTGDDAGVLGDELTEVSGSLEGGCSTAPSSGGAGVRGGLGLAALALVASVRRRRRA